MGNRGSRNTSSFDNKISDIEFLKENTEFDEETLEKFHLCFLQDSSDGKMSKKEFCLKFQSSFCCGRNNEGFSSHLFEALDTDQNGIIDFREAFKRKNRKYIGLLPIRGTPPSPL